MKASLQGKDNFIHQLKKQLSQLQVTRSDTDRTLKVWTTDSQITKLTDQVTHLQAQNDLFRAENDKIKQHHKELYDSIKITRAKHIDQVTKLTTKNVNLKTSVSKDKVNPQVLVRDKHAIDVEPIVPRLRNNKDAYLDYLRHLKESDEIIRDIVEEAKVVVQIVLWYLDLGCSKHMTGDRSWLMNFVKKFIGTVRFGNDHFGAIMGYGDYVICDSVISMVYYVEGLGHNLFSVGQFCDSDLEVAFRKHSCYVRDTDGVELIKGSRWSNLYTILVEDMMKSSPICLLSKASKNKSWLWHRRLNHLNFGTSSTNFLGTKYAASQDVKKDVSSLRYIALPNWFHEAYLESSTSNAQDACNADASESNGNSNPTATSTNPHADQMETLIVETAIPTVSLPIPTACLDDSPEPSSGTRLISKKVTSQDDTPSLDNILNLSN
nr:integrase, catalytic region, zinc finger, CCHC-type, peptidase aspartic, catalytic [Tanacetum cinerariifolium]